MMTHRHHQSRKTEAAGAQQEHIAFGLYLLCSAKGNRFCLVKTQGLHDTHFRRHPDQYSGTHHLELLKLEAHLHQDVKTQHWSDGIGLFDVLVQVGVNQVHYIWL